jgi:F-type H+-transporting ATPase subunit g
MQGLVARIPAIITPIMEYAKPRLATLIKYGKIELAPPSLADLPEAFAQVSRLVESAKTHQWKQLTVKQAWLNTLVATEVGCWFFIGECIGKGSLVAYKVNGPGEHHGKH